MTNSLRPVLEQLETAGLVIQNKLLKEYHGVETDDDGNALVDANGDTIPNIDQWDWDPRGKTIITIQNPGRRKENGWFRGQVWESDSNNILNALAGESDPNEKFDEISIADHMMSKSVEEIIYELFHQEIHAVYKSTWPATLGANGYHPLGFKRRAGSWFKVETSPSKGWNQCEPREVLKEFVKDEVIPKLDTTVFDLMRDKNSVRTGQVGSNLKKWSCDCTNLRVSTWMKGKCLRCGTEFRYTDKDADTESVKNWLDSNEADWKAAQSLNLP